MSGSPFPVDPVLTGVVIAYANAELIADRVLPRVQPLLPREQFKYMKFSFAEAVTVPDTTVGRKSAPNEVEFSGTELDGSTKDYGLDDVVPSTDVANAPAGYDPLTYAAQGVMDLVLLDREKRVADIVFNLNTYPAGNRVTLSGTSQWSDSTSDPTVAIMDAKDSMIMKPNKMVMGQAAWTKVRRHPKIISAISVSGTDKGTASLQAVAELWELDEIIVGAAQINTAKKGQNPALARAWGKHASLFRADALATSLNKRPTFGATFQFGTRVAGQIPEPKIGLRGSTRVRAGESVAEVICAADLALLAKIEADYGTDSVPTGAANAIQASEVSLTPLAGEEVRRDLMLPYLGNQGAFLVGDHVELQFQVEIAGAGAAGTVPAYGVLLRACGCAETVEEDTSVTYEPVSSGEEAATLYANLDGVQHKLLGARGTVSLNLAPKQIPRFSFTVRGLLTPILDAALPAVTLAAFQTPLVVSKANTPTFSLHGYSAIAESLALDLANTIEVRNLIGEDSIQRTDRQSTGTAVLEAKSVATKDWFSIARSHAVGALSVVHGTMAGNIVEFAALAVQIGRPTYGNTQGITNMSLPLMLKPVTGDDELSIIVR